MRPGKLNARLSMTAFLPRSLPDELWDLVTDFLDPKDLCSFSRACSSTCKIADRVLYRQITLRLTAYHTVAAETSSWSETLSRRSAWESVRRVAIIVRYSHQLKDASVQDEPEHSGNVHKWPKDAEDFRPLESFLQRTSRLRDLEWACDQVFPGFLLPILADPVANCRIHIKGIKLSHDRRTPLSDDEVELVTSAQLHSVGLRYSGPDIRLREALLSMIKSGPPNLHHVSYSCAVSYLYQRGLVMRMRGRGRPAGSRVVNVPDGRKLNDIIERCAPRPGGRSIGALLSLAIYDQYWLGDILKAFQLATDFSLLTAFRLENGPSVETLCFLADECQFTALQTLALGKMSNKDYYSPSTPDEQMRAQGALNRLFESLPALRNLSLVGFYQDTFFHILSQHGHQLNKLELEYCILDDRQDEWLTSPEAVEALWSQCPNLTRLFLPLHRLSGNAREVAFYQGLGRCSSLIDIKLEINCDVRDRVYGPAGGHFRAFSAPRDDNPLDSAVLRSLLANSAVDETLARSILKIITDSRPVGSPALRQLTLICEEEAPPSTLPENLQAFVEEIRHSWRCTRNHKGKYTIERIEGKPPRPGHTPNKLWSPAKPLTPIEPQARAVIKEFWPDWNEENWTEGWHSFPLAEVPGSKKRKSSDGPPVLSPEHTVERRITRSQASRLSS